ncbi:TonB-dependent receptor [Sphingoaurantiacus capsulatus]
MMRYRMSLFTTAATIAVICGSGAAFAQDAATTPPADAVVAETDETDSGEIVVTAERRATSLQKVSAAIQVVTGENLTKIGIVDTENLQVRVPAMVNSRLGGPTQRPYIRGIGNDLYGIASGNSIATYVDGVYIPNSTQSFQAFLDTERVEVLKGPQAVLYGRNATGGTVLISSKKPEFEFGGSGDISYGNYNDFQVRGAVTGPIVDDVIAVRIAAQYLDRDGFGKNIPSGKDQDFFRNFAVRGSMLMRLGENLTALAVADYSKIETGDYVKTPNQNAWNYQATVGQYVEDPWLRYGNHDSFAPLTDAGMRLTLNWDTSFGEITSTTSFREFKYGPFTYDNDDVGMPLSLPTNPRTVLGELAIVGSVQESDQFSHETYLATPTDKPLRLIVGGSVFLEDAIDQQRSFFFAPRFSNRALDNPAYAAFADAKFDLTEKLTLSAGARYSSEKKRYTLQPLNATLAGVITGTRPTVEGNSKWNDFTPRFGVEYRPTNDVMLFATATKGFKSGGFNTDNPANEFEPEDIWSYEGGIKSRWGGFLTVNLSAFYYDYSNLQVQQVLLPAGTSIVTNASEAKIKGLDGEIIVRAADGLTIGTNFALLDSEYGDLTLFNDLLAVPTNVSVEGNVLKRAPKTSVVTYVDYDVPIGAGELSFHGEAMYRSKTYYTPFQDEPHAQPGFWLLNANIRYSFDDNRQYISLYGQNLANKLYATSIEDVARFLGPLDGAPLYTHYGQPRTYGVRYGISF